MAERDELLDDDQALIAEAIADLCTGFDDDYWAKCDREHEFPWDFYGRLAEGGWLGLAIPEEYGGGGRGITDAAVMLHEIARSGAAMNGCSAVHLTVFGLNPVVKFGSGKATTSSWTGPMGMVKLLVRSSEGAGVVDQAARILAFWTSNSAWVRTPASRSSLSFISSP